MSFTRKFDFNKIEQLKNHEIYKDIETDIFQGDIFPAIRSGKIDFYYKGGLLYRYSGKSFRRNPNYKEYGDDVKQQNENKNTRKGGMISERQLLGNLCSHTFRKNENSNVIVLDVEVNLTGPKGKKCDMVLLNIETGQLMFVEGKVFSDSRVNTEKERPEVIDQIEAYNSDFKGDLDNILEQYCRYIDTINALFDTNYKHPVSLIKTAKLLVYGTPENPFLNGQCSKESITEQLGSENIYWVKAGLEPSINQIWDELTEGEKCK